MKVCRTCLQVLSNDAKCLSLDPTDCNLDLSLRNKLHIFIPDLALDILQCPVICIECSDALNIAYKFKNTCLQTEDKIQNYLQFSGCTTDSLDVSELIQYNEFNVKANFVEIKPQINSIHYPITQMAEDDTELDVKPVIEKDDINLSNSECKTSDPVITNGLPKLLFGPELDVVVSNYAMDPISMHSQSNSLNCTKNSNDTSRTCCQKTFPLPGQLENHLLTHMENRPLKCTMCERRFVRKDKLMLHMRIHTGEKPFACTLCGRCFSRKDKLNNHMRTHTGEKPHQCILCQKSFARKDKMNTHMRSKHWLALANLEITVVKSGSNIEKNTTDGIVNP